MTRRSLIRERVLISSSVRPSAKYSSLGSGLMLARGRTARCSREAVGESGAGTSQGSWTRVDLHRDPDVLEDLRLELLERIRDLIADLVEDLTRDAESPGGCKRFDAGGDVHRVAEDIGPARLYVPEVNPDAKLDGRDARPRIALVQMLMDVDGALHGPERAVEFDQEPVAHRLYLASLISTE